MYCPTPTSASDVLLNKYHLGRLLGRGSFAKVYSARSLSDDSQVAIKIIDKSTMATTNSTMMEQQVLREVAAMRRLRHPNIVQIHELMATKSKIYLVMDYAPGGDLFSKLLKHRRFTEPLARLYFHQLVSTVHFCHLHGVSHRDIKPHNLLLDLHGNLKVSDFGLSALHSDNSDNHNDNHMLHRTSCGTPAYAAPEVFGRKGYNGPKADAWSCGIILYVLLAGYVPFDDSNLALMFRKMRKKEFEFPPWISKAARRVISRLLEPNPDKRMSVEEVMGIVWLRRSTSACEFTTSNTTSTTRYTTTSTSTIPSSGSIGIASFIGLMDEEEEENRHEDDELGSTNSNSLSSSSSSSSSSITNAFDIISRSAGLDLSGLFEGEKEKKNEKKFTSTAPPEKIVERVVETGGRLGYSVKRKKGGVIGLVKGRLVIVVEVLEIAASLFLVDVKCVGEGLKEECWGDLRDGLGDIVVTNWHNEAVL
ncbi:hypothetical protein Sjap_008142 [Stephania japonica]|uniref:non-specific serine/threonine protein kinase n=1 Tax=Stephania japonica TaxID=461633 RepID=A0AAP0JNX9_9MAGN